MVDRRTVYAGQIPLETDILYTNQYGMIGLAKFCAAVLGQTTIVNGFTCTPTSPASLNVIVTAGEVYQIANLEATTWSSLSTDTHSILKQGIVLDPTTFGITPPNTVGYSQNFLIEAQYQDTDSGSTVLPYFNSANPSVPFSGPANAGTAQNTVRKGVAALQVKAGIAATTGTQTTPSADAGWTGMFVVTVANGASTITSGNISQLAAAPFLATNGYLPQIPTGVLNNTWAYAADTGTVNALAVTLAPIPASYVAGMTVRIKVGNTNTGATTINVNSLGAKAVTRVDGTAISANDLIAGEVIELVYDGTNFQVQNYNPLQAQPRIYQVLTTSQTFVIPAGCFGINYQIAGGGGGGGAGNSAAGTSGGGGGGAGAAIGFQNVLPGDNLVVTIGAGGAGGAGTAGAQGAAGGSTTISIASKFTVTVNGGGAGNTGAVGAGGTGGAGFGASTNSYGSPGGGGGAGSIRGSSTYALGGTGGGNMFGVGGQSNSASTGTVGGAPGSGGGGGYTDATNTYGGGAGANGVVILRY